MITRPSARDEIRLLSMRTLQGANYWSTSPVTRFDLNIGAYDEISSAMVPGFTDALVDALPGFEAHRCSVGEPGGFVRRLREGTYAAHIAEHVAIELQVMIGHDVGFGRARAAEEPGEYTVVVGHCHARVGRGAAGLALEFVRDAFDGRPLDVASALGMLRRLANVPDLPVARERIYCGVIGNGKTTAAAANELRRRTVEGAPIIRISPAEILDRGLPYATSDVAIVADREPAEVPRRFRDPQAGAHLLSVVADAVTPGGLVVIPDHDRWLREEVEAIGRRVALFSASSADAEGSDRSPTGISSPAAVDTTTSLDPQSGVVAIGRVVGDRIVVELPDRVEDVGQVHPHAAPAAQAAAAVAAALSRQRR